MSNTLRYRMCGLRQLACLLLIGWLGWTPAAWAQSCTVPAPNFTLPAPGNISVGADIPVGTPLGTPVQATVVFTCPQFLFASTPTTIQAATAGTVSGNTVMFQTSVAGIGLQLTGSPSALATGGSGFVVGTIPSAGGSLSETFTGQLVVTGPVSPGTIGSLTLVSNFDWSYVDIFGATVTTKFRTPNAKKTSTLQLTGGTVISAPTCSVNAPTNIPVTLPTFNTNVFTGIGTTVGSTPLNISITCSATGPKVLVTMTSSNPNGITGVTNPTTGAGYAQGIGVQLLGQDGVTPVDVTGNVQQSVATVTTTSAYLIPYYAQYYQTAASVTGGTVSAAITYAITYQ